MASPFKMPTASPATPAAKAAKIVIESAPRITAAPRIPPNVASAPTDRSNPCPPAAITIVWQRRKEAQECGNLELVGDLPEPQKTRQQDLPDQQQDEAETQQQNRPPPAHIHADGHANLRCRCSKTMKPKAATITSPLKNSCQILGIPAK